jgi:hypothetical protein
MSGNASRSPGTRPSAGSMTARPQARSSSPEAQRFPRAWTPTQDRAASSESGCGPNAGWMEWQSSRSPCWVPDSGKAALPDDPREEFRGVVGLGWPVWLRASPWQASPVGTVFMPILPGRILPGVDHVTRDTAPAPSCLTSRCPGVSSACLMWNVRVCLGCGAVCAAARSMWG